MRNLKPSEEISLLLLGISGVLTAIGALTYSPEPVTYDSCVVTDTYKTFSRVTHRVVETENCGRFGTTTREVFSEIEVGETYDFTETGYLSWTKTLTKAEEK